MRLRVWILGFSCQASEKLQADAAFFRGDEMVVSGSVLGEPLELWRARRVHRTSAKVIVVESHPTRHQNEFGEKMTDFLFVSFVSAY